MTTPADGVYSLRPALNINQVSDVEGQSKSNYANLWIYGPNAGDPVGNHQKVMVTTTGVISKMRLLHSSKMVDVSGGGAASGTNVQQYEQNNTNAQKWVFRNTNEITGTSTDPLTGTINGQTIDSWEIRSKVSDESNYVLDATSGQSSSGTNIQIYRRNNTVAQRWFLVKDCKFKSLSVPSSVGIATSSGGEVLKTVYTTASNFTFYPAFVCPNSRYQIRYRKRLITENGAEAWSLWKSPSGLTTDDGYGDVWTYNQDLSAQSQSNKKYGTAITESFDWNNKARYELQICVRSFDTTDNSSGSAAISTVTINKAPTITVGTPQMSPNGLLLPITGTPARPNTNWTLSNVLVGTNLVCNDVEYVGYSGNYTIPFDDMLTIPSSGDTITFDVSFSNYFATKSQSFSNTVSYEQYSGFNAIIMNAPLTLEIGISIFKEVQTQLPDRVKNFLKYKHKGEYKTIRVGGSEEPYQVFDGPLFSAVLYSIIEDGDEWGIKYRNVGFTDQNLIAWKTETELIKCSEFKDVNIIDDDYQRDSDSYHTYGANYHDYYFTKGGNHKYSVSGLVVHKNDIEKYKRLQDAGYALFRTPEFYGRVAITEIKYERLTKDYYSVSVEQYEVN